MLAPGFRPPAGNRRLAGAAAGATIPDSESATKGPVRAMYSNKVIDAGTPARRSATTVSLTIDGVPVTVPAGTSVMRAAVEAGVRVPKL